MIFESENADPISVNCPATACDAQWADAGAQGGAQRLARGLRTKHRL